MVFLIHERHSEPELVHLHMVAMLRVPAPSALGKVELAELIVRWASTVGTVSLHSVKIPVVVSAFPEEICPAPRKWAEKAYPKLVYYKRHPKGAHFAAWEQPQGIVEDLRAGLKSLR